MDLEIEIDIESGNVILNRDHELMLELAKTLNPEEYQAFEDFFNRKPLDINGNINYNSFCG